MPERQNPTAKPGQLNRPKNRDERWRGPSSSTGRPTTEQAGHSPDRYDPTKATSTPPPSSGTASWVLTSEESRELTGHTKTIRQIMALTEDTKIDSIVVRSPSHVAARHEGNWYWVPDLLMRPMVEQGDVGEPPLAELIERFRLAGYDFPSRLKLALAAQARHRLGLPDIKPEELMTWFADAKRIPIAQTLRRPKSLARRKLLSWSFLLLLLLWVSILLV